MNVLFQLPELPVNIVLIMVLSHLVEVVLINVYELSQLEELVVKLVAKLYAVVHFPELPETKLNELFQLADDAEIVFKTGKNLSFT